MSADSAHASVDRFFALALAAPVFDFVPVPFEFERVDRCNCGIGFAEGAIVDQEIDVLLVSYGIVPGAFGADPMIALKGDFVVGVAALFALDPDALGDLAFDPGFEPGLHFFEPVQEKLLLDQAAPFEPSDGDSGGD